MAINSSGNLGLGVTPSATPFGVRSINVGLQGYIWSDAASYKYNSGITNNAYVNGNDTFAAISSRDASVFELNGNTFIWRQASTGTAGSTLSLTSAMTLNASGNLGIGTTSPAQRLTIAQTNGYPVIDFNNSGTAYGDVGFQVDKMVLSAYSSTPLTFWTNSAERARITSGGALLINTTTVATNALFEVSSNGTKKSFQVYNNDNVQLYSLGTGTVYSNSGVLTNTNPSDLRLKTDVQDLSWGLSQILALRPVSYAWKNNHINQGTQYGFIAQEVQTVMPDLVREFETKDGEETVTRFGLEKDGIYAAMVKAIQEQQAIIESLKARLDAANL
jgi:hypothetical protein